MRETLLTGKYQEIIPDEYRKAESLHHTENLKESTSINKEKDGKFSITY